MPVSPGGNHAAIAAWIQGGMSETERLEFEAHLATCSDCQAEVAAFRRAQAKQPTAAAATAAALKPKPPATTLRRSGQPLWTWLILAVLLVIAGYLLGSWAWQMAQH